MDQPPGRDANDLQTLQDFSAVVELTREEQCAIAMKNPSWYQNADQSSSTTLPPSYTAPCTVPSVGQILPDNAFSRTRVTLSYVSRSHIFSTQDALSGNSSMYGISTFNKYSLQPSCAFGEVDMALNQPYLENMDGPCDLAAHTDLLHSLSEAQLNLDMEANMKQTYELNGASQLDTSEQLNVDDYEHLHNSDNIWLNKSLPYGSTSLPESLAALQESKGSNSSSKKAEYFRNNCSLPKSPTVTTEYLESVHCSDTLQENAVIFNSRREGPESLHMCLGLVSEEEALEKLPKASKESPAHLGGCYNPLQECQEMGKHFNSLQNYKDVLDGDSVEVVCVSSEKLVEIKSPVEDPSFPSAISLEEVFILSELSNSPSRHNSFLKITDSCSSTQDTIHPVSEDGTTSLLSNRFNDSLRRKSEPLIDLTDDACMSDVLEENIKNAEVLNGNTKALQKTINKRKLPTRTGRGMRVESLVMNINSSQYNVSACIQAGKKSPQINNETKVTPCKSNRLSGSKKSKTKSLPKKCHSKASSAGHKKYTSGLHSQSTANRKALQPSPVKLKCHSYVDHIPPSANSQESLSLNSTLDISVGSVSSIPEFPKSPLKRQRKTNETFTNKAKSKSTHRKKLRKVGNASSIFSSKEPEIKLKYLNNKEEKQDLKTDSFSPFIRVQGKEEPPTLFTVVNYPEKVKMPQKSNQQQGTFTAYTSSVVPTTSCLRLGRASMQGDQQRALVCCLCGQSANAMDLGDLHGPYYLEGHQPAGKGSKEKGLKGEEDASDSDLSSCSGDRKWTSRNRAGRSLATKRARTDVEDWYSPPLVPQDPCEYWFHEDCGVWSAGVFLVQSRVYGLEEAVRAAQSTKCLSCGDRGASLGCLFKGCPNKYHYRCALHSDCVLEEDNFSMKCRKHKNKSIAAFRSSHVEPR